MTVWLAIKTECAKQSVEAQPCPLCTHLCSAGPARHFPVSTCLLWKWGESLSAFLLPYTLTIQGSLEFHMIDTNGWRRILLIASFPLPDISSLPLHVKWVVCRSTENYMCYKGSAGAEKSFAEIPFKVENKFSLTFLMICLCLFATGVHVGAIWGWGV